MRRWRNLERIIGVRNSTLTHEVIQKLLLITLASLATSLVALVLAAWALAE